MEERGGARVGFRHSEKKGEQMRGQRGKRDAVPAVAKRTGGTVGASLSHLRRCCRPPQPLLPPPSSNSPRVPPSSLPSHQIRDPEASGAEAEARGGQQRTAQRTSPHRPSRHPLSLYLFLSRGSVGERGRGGAHLLAHEAVALLAEPWSD
jgi:hypothetical protein